MNPNELVFHPLQSREWEEFNRARGFEVVRCRKNSILTLIQREKTTQVGMGYIPKGPLPNEDQIREIRELARQTNCLTIKIEPDFGWSYPLSERDEEEKRTVETLLQRSGGRPAKRILFPATFLVDLKRPEDELRRRLHPKTRYNIGLAQRHHVTIETGATAQDFENFLELFQTNINPRLPEVRRYSPEYLRTFWRIFGETGAAFVLTASWRREILAAAVVLKFRDRLFYPYGASRRTQRAVMAPTLLMWEVIRFGRQLGCRELDLWGAADGGEPGGSYDGVHRFFQGFGGQWHKLMPAWDLFPARPQ